MKVEYIKSKEAAELLGINIKVFRYWIYKKKVPMQRIGTGHPLFDKEELLQWWASAKNNPSLEDNQRPLSLTQELSRLRQLLSPETIVKPCMEVRKTRKKKKKLEANHELELGVLNG